MEIDMASEMNLESGLRAAGATALASGSESGPVTDSEPEYDGPKYGLELTNNSKVGYAFSLPRSKTCIGATAICKKLCYGNGIRYQSRGQRAKRERNFRTVEHLLDIGGPRLLAQNLLVLVDSARPIDYLAAKYAGGRTTASWTLRVHDTGDYPENVGYIRAWYLAMKARPECSFWFYTRSFCSDKILRELTKLIRLPNCRGWLSIDRENYLLGLDVYERCPGWKVALLQEAPGVMPEEVILAVYSAVRPFDLVVFPYHHGGRHVEPILDSRFVVCPQVLGQLPLETRKHVPKPCQICRFCLP